MKKGYYIYSENCGSVGVMNKISMQIEALNKYVNIEPIQIEDKKNNIIVRLYNMLPWNSYSRNYDSVLEKMTDPDFVYIRRVFLDKAYLTFLRDIHKKWKECKIIQEIPVYPYEKDMKNGIYTYFMYIKEVILRRHYSDDVNRFVTYSDDEILFGVKTIKTMNGVNVDKCSIVNFTKEYDSTRIVLIAVAALLPHHGYERIIEGIKNYYEKKGNRDIIFHIIGDGTEKEKYQSLINNYNLSKHIIMHSTMVGAELNSLMEEADIGVGAFGAYKDGVEKLCTIKVREYIAKGLPVMTGCDDNLFLGDAKPYGLIYPNNNTAIDINLLSNYLDDLYMSKGKRAICDEIRQIAYKTVDNQVTLRPVIDYILS